MRSEDILTADTDALKLRYAFLHDHLQLPHCEQRRAQLVTEANHVLFEIVMRDGQPMSEGD